MIATNTPKKIAEQIKSHALSLGFDLVGFSQIKADSAAYAHYEKWLEKGNAGDLTYMSEKERVEKRRTAKSLLPNAKTVISLAVNYYHAQSPLPRDHGRVAMYAYGRDYHKVIGKKLKELEKFIQNFSSNTLSYVDTGPILERTFAVQAGLGFIGKNTTLITPEFGSFVFLAEIITDLEIEKSTRVATTQFCQKDKSPSGYTVPVRRKLPLISCGSCTRCIDACPTKALNKTFLNAKKCIAYNTIEHKAPLSKIPTVLRKAMKQSKYIFGCDICQLVCPHNCRAKESVFGKSQKIAGDSLSLEKIAAIKSDEEFLKLFAGSPLMRAKLKSLKRNAKILN